MRIHRISLRDFRGVESLDVELDPRGVTVIEGRNESGKTSIADALMLLLDDKDSSGKREVREVRPIGRDVGPFAEAELTIGRFRLVYRKRWLKERMTELEIAEPQPEQLSGEAAHSRMLQILEENTDQALFAALRYQQGVAISQAAVAESSSLQAALDAAAGGTGARAGAGEEVLLDRVEKERLRYFTEKGATLGARKKQAEQLQGLQAEVESCEAQIREIEHDAERQQEVERELQRLGEQLPATERQVGELSAAVAEIEALERRAESARHRHEQAQSALREAKSAQQRRQGLIESARSAASAVAEAEKATASAAPELESAQSALAAAEREHAAARSDVESGEQESARSRTALELFEWRDERDRLQEREERVAQADEAIEAAQRFLDGCAVEERLLAEIDEAANRVAIAEGRAQAGRPRLSLEALQPVEVLLDAERIDAVPGEPIERTVSERAELRIGDLARIVVGAAELVGDAEQALGEARRQLDGLLRDGEVASQAQAHEMARERSRHDAALESAKQRRADALNDLQRAELAAKLERARQKLAALEAERDPAGAAAGSFEDARELSRRADAALQRARSAQKQSQTALAAAQGSLRVLEDEGIQQRTRLEGAQTEATRSAAELEQARLQAADDELAQALAAAEQRLLAAAAEQASAVQELEAGDPRSARAMLQNARATEERLLQDTERRKIESAETGARLQLSGHQGLSDRLAEARARLQDLRREVDSEERRAAAVQRLHAVLAEKREKARQAYIGPFAKKVSSYAHILYGPGAEVAVDHGSLQIASRTLDGTTVPYGQLSGGAREQLAVLARLACGALVSPADADGRPGGVPVMIDDALGYSDPGRLERLGAAIAVAGRDCQVIVLTCEPGRYRGVGGARVISLS